MVTGVDGQLGHDLVLTLQTLNVDIVGLSREEFDLTNTAQIKDYILKETPDMIIHSAAYTAVDNAEEEKEMCHAVNVEGTRAIANAAKDINAKVVYISTDYVFDGLG